MSDYGSTPPPPPPPPGGGYAAPPPSQGGAGAEHPEGQKLFILSIVGLICCAPINIYVFIAANNILNAPVGDVSKVKTAKTIALIGLILWAVGIVFNFAVGGMSFLGS